MHRRTNDNDCAYRGHQVRRRETKSPAAASHDLGSRQCQECGADDNGTQRKAGNRDTCKVGGQQCADGRADGNADAADYLRDEEQAQRAALDGDDVNVCIVHFSAEGCREG